MKRFIQTIRRPFQSIGIACGMLYIATISSVQAIPLNLSQVPLFLTKQAAPMTMLVMGRNYKLYHEAYNDAADLNGDGVIDSYYNPKIDYVGYFDSYTCYKYDSSAQKYARTATTTDKTCSGDWSGDFLNYMTMTRMDVLRKALYGGHRIVDTSTDTVLERLPVPIDTYNWAKEYTSVAVDGYDISDYTPLPLPATDTRHIFSNVTLVGSTDPLLRVLSHSRYRAWELVQKDNPTTGLYCYPNGNQAAAALCTDAPTSTTSSAAVNNKDDMDDIFATNAVPANFDKNVILSNIDYATNEDDYVLRQVTAQIDTAKGEYSFAVDGDDAVDVFVDGTYVAGFYGLHPVCTTSISQTDIASCAGHYGKIELKKGTHNILFRHVENTGQEVLRLYWKGPDSTGADWELVPATSLSNVLLTQYKVSSSGAVTVSTPSVLTEYTVRVNACEVITQADCKQYPSSPIKPIGILHEFGEDDTMLFGMISGSYEKNTSGGVLRKIIGSFTDEVDLTTGIFTGTGIVDTINSINAIGYGGKHFYDFNCGWNNKPVEGANCNMMGNPMGEMMYESLRYFAGKKKPTAAYAIGSSGNDDAKLGLPLPAWNDPFETIPYCSQPFQLVISDVNPSFDSDQLPGVYTDFASSTSGANAFVSDMPSTLNVSDLSDYISSYESDIAGLHFIGQVGSDFDGMPTAKKVSTLKDIRGMAPDQPSREGSYYSAAVAYYGLTNDLNPATGDQTVQTFSVALDSPLPHIIVPLNGKDITIVPIAKTVGGSMIGSIGSGIQPTNSIVSFYIESMTPTYGSIRIAFEEAETGSKHDLNGVVHYEYSVYNDAGIDKLKIKLTSEFGLTSMKLHYGYVISGTTQDGLYLEVRDADTTEKSDPDYRFDTPPGELPGGNWADKLPLPLIAERVFLTNPSNDSATYLKNTLWYAAKWGGFIDDHVNPNQRPDGEEWDLNKDGDPDNYFLVANPNDLKNQLRRAFSEILERSGSSATVAINSGSIKSDTLLYQAKFNSGKWYGQLLAFGVDAQGNATNIVWDSAEEVEKQHYLTGREIITYHTGNSKGIPFRWPTNYTSPSTTELSTDQINDILAGYSGTDKQAYGQAVLNYVRGDRSQEEGALGGIYNFRVRNKVLGDLVHSDPVYVAEPRLSYPDKWGDNAPENAAYYSTFKQKYESRTPTVYVGGNDGIMHAFNGLKTGGNELFGYVPSMISHRLQPLTNTVFDHHYIVDGNSTVSDVFFNGAWHTVLVGTLGGGGQGLFALDVTDPSLFSETNASKLALWEFSDNNDAELGYTYSQPSLVRLNNGKWAALVGNGHNNTEIDSNFSSTGNAVLYVLDIETGAVIRKFDTLKGASADPLAKARPNGLASPVAVDNDGDFIADTIYVGDLFGNLWKIDASSTDPAKWDFAFGTTASPEPLYIAKDDSGLNQPITSRPSVAKHPYLDGSVLVFFGTGKYLESGDQVVSVTDQTQSFYSIWDDGYNGRTRSNLLEQTITQEGTTTAGIPYRLTSDNPINWDDVSLGNLHKGWYIDFETAATGNRGERQVTNSLVRQGRVTFTTLVPSQDICSFGGSGWLMTMDVTSGSRASPTFDLNNDQKFDANDLLDTDGDGIGDTPVSGVMPGNKDGIPSSPAILTGCANGDADCNIISKSTGDIETIRTKAHGVGRQNWRQVR